MTPSPTQLVGAAIAVAAPAAGVVGTAIDGPLLGGIAAIITAISTFVLGLVALLISKRKPPPAEVSAEAWRAIAEQLLREHYGPPDADADHDEHDDDTEPNGGDHDAASQNSTPHRASPRRRARRAR